MTKLEEPMKGNVCLFQANHYMRVGSILFITLLAFFLRTHQLATVPPAFDYDEAAHALDAIDILSGHQMIFSPKIEGTPTLFMYLEAIFFGLFGVRTFVGRLMVAFLATLTIPLAYVMVCRIFASLGLHRAHLISILTTAGLATSFWHLDYSRIALEYALVPLAECVIFYLLFRGLQTNRSVLLILSGAALGLSVYIYVTPRFLPVVLVLFFICRQLTQQQYSASFQTSWRPLLLTGLSALIIFAPLGAYFVQNPSDFFRRAEHTLFTNPQLTNGNPSGTLVHSFLGNLGAFGFTSDMFSQANLPGKPILDPVMAALFWAGLLVSLAHFRREPYAFCFLWWAILLIPVVITPDRVPHYGRLLSVAPVAYVFPAMTIDTLERAMSHRPLQRTVLPGLAIAATLAFGYTTFATYRDYFVRWASSEDTYQAFQGPAMELAQLMNRDKAEEAVYILPCDPLAGTSCDYYPLDFFRSDGAPHRTIRMEESQVPTVLTKAVQGKRIVHLVYLKNGKRKFLGAEADPKDYLPFLLGSVGLLEREETFRYYDIRTYRLPSKQTLFASTTGFRPPGALFDGKLKLLGVWAPAEVKIGRSLPIALQWEVHEQPKENYRATVRLLNGEHLLGQIDHVLYTYGRRGTSKWTTQDGPITDYYLLPIPAEAKPSECTLRIGLYTLPTMQLVPVEPPTEANLIHLGSIQLWH